MPEADNVSECSSLVCVRDWIFFTKRIRLLWIQLCKLTIQHATLHCVLLWTKFQAVCVLIGLECGTFFSFPPLIPTPSLHILARQDTQSVKTILPTRMRRFITRQIETQV
jgi:hypothetical protein